MVLLIDESQKRFRYATLRKREVYSSTFDFQHKIMLDCRDGNREGKKKS